MLFSVASSFSVFSLILFLSMLLSCVLCVRFLYLFHVSLSSLSCARAKYVEILNINAQNILCISIGMPYTIYTLQNKKIIIQLIPPPSKEVYQLIPSLGSFLLLISKTQKFESNDTLLSKCLPISMCGRCYLLLTTM